MNDTVVDRVSCGVGWLDENVPGWHNRIDLGKFHIIFSDCCVLGQLEGDFWDFLVVYNKSFD